jgi:hypothetical protein
VIFDNNLMGDSPVSLNRKNWIQDTLLMLIAVSSFGESLRRVLPHRPGGGDFNAQSIPPPLAALTR